MDRVRGGTGQAVDARLDRRASRLTKAADGRGRVVQVPHSGRQRGHLLRDGVDRRAEQVQAHLRRLEDDLERVEPGGALDHVVDVDVAEFKVEEVSLRFLDPDPDVVGHVLDRRTDPVLDRLPARLALVPEIDQVFQRDRDAGRIDVVEQVIERLFGFLAERTDLVAHGFEWALALFGEAVLERVTELGRVDRAGLELGPQHGGGEPHVRGNVGEVDPGLVELLERPRGQLERLVCLDRGGNALADRRVCLGALVSHDRLGAGDGGDLRLELAEVGDPDRLKLLGPLG